MRSFLMRHYRALALVSLLFFTTAILCGCGLPQWISTAQQILPIASQMALAIITLIGALAGKTLGTDVASKLAQVVGKIQSGLQDIQSMVEEYNSSPSPTLLGSIQVGVKAVLDNVDQFLADTGITDTATNDKIKAVLLLIQTELTAWASMLPIFSAVPGQKFTVEVPLSSKEFKAQYNAIIGKPTGNPSVDAALAHLKKL